MKVLVTTPNGKVGNELVKLLQKGKVVFRLGAHTVEKARAQFPGAEVVKLDYQDPATLKAAVQGVTAVYLAAPGDISSSAPEIQLIEAAKAAGVQRFVKLSAIGVEQAPDTVPIRQVEKHLEGAGVAFTILRPNWFMQNFSTGSAEGIRSGTLAEPAAEARTSFIDARDIAAVAYAVLTQAGHEGKAYTLTGPQTLSRKEVAEAIAKELGKPVRYLAVSDEQFRAAVKPVLPASYVELLSSLYGGVRAGWTEARTDEVKQITGRDPISLGQFVRDHRGVWA